MGYKKQSELRRAENEVIFKAHNQFILEQVNNILPESNKPTFKIAFICECSDEACQKKIALTVRDFRRHTMNPRRFIIKPGHEQPDIEQVIDRRRGYELVEKFELPPTTDGVLNAT